MQGEGVATEVEGHLQMSYLIQSNEPMQRDDSSLAPIVTFQVDAVPHADLSKITLAFNATEFLPNPPLNITSDQGLSDETIGFLTVRAQQAQHTC